MAIADNARELARVIESLEKKCALQDEMIAKQHAMIVAQGEIIKALRGK